MINSLKVLGIESSCDDTAASVVTIFHKKTNINEVQINSSIVYNQNEIHRSFGGIVPELAARAHAEKLDLCVEKALTDSDETLKNIDLLAVTSGPGLIGGLISGVTFAKSLSFALNKPLIGVNHLVGHALTPRLTHAIPYPYLIFIASGGHCQFLIVKGPSEFKRIGGTIDDAPGEAFDKTAKILGLGFPGGPNLEKQALNGDPFSFKLPLPLVKENNCNMSFSGLKTALRREVDQIIKKNEILTEVDINNLCASFQQTMVEIFQNKTKKAMETFRSYYPNIRHEIAVAGGVASNKRIGLALSKIAEDYGFKLIIPEAKLCTDNAAMIAFAGGELFLNKMNCPNALVPRPRWPLDRNTAPMIGSGKKGRKA